VRLELDEEEVTTSLFEVVFPDTVIFFVTATD
jgi:hypothetical protein